MVRLLLALSIALSVLASPATVAAEPGKGKGRGHNKGGQVPGHTWPKFNPAKPGGFTPPGHLRDIPELDPSGVGSAAVLLIGGTLLLVDRRRRMQRT